MNQVSKDYRKLVHEITKLGLFDKKGNNIIFSITSIATLFSLHLYGVSAAAVALMDSDGDGLLSLEDFVKIVEGAGEEEKQSDLKAAFKLYAPEGSSCITAESLKKMLSRLGQRRSVHDCKNMIAPFDINGDGVLNFDEFKIMLLSYVTNSTLKSVPYTN
ncbi:calcium-binding protein CML38-like [Salvia hispanica]|uniref:calcium-binding protein CML38-like n=1 Tax=Salvia hispanica TaxID=49212 RepID=UPI00200925CE|nr:calcium-binding protein CML38-like [Salvia hispanica]